MTKNYSINCFLGLLLVFAIITQTATIEAFSANPIKNVPTPSINSTTNSTSAFSVRDTTNFTITPSEPYAFEKSGDLLDGKPVDFSVQNGLAAIASGEGGVQILNVTDPTKIELVSSIERRENSNNYDLSYNSVFLDNNYLYAVNNRYFEIYDITNPYNAQLISELEQYASKIIVNNSLAYLLRINEILIFNISNPYTPTLISSYFDSDLSASTMELHNNLLFIGSYLGKVLIMNVSDPYYTTMLSQTYLGENNMILSLAYQTTKKILHIGTNGNETVMMLDINDPKNPVKIGSYRTINIIYSGGTTTILDPKGITIQDDLAFIADTTRIVTVNISDPIAPIAIHVFSSVSLTRYTIQLEFQNSFLIALDQLSYMYSINASDIYNQNVVGNFSTIATINDFAIQGEIVYAATDHGFMSINMTVPGSPQILDTYRPDIGHYRKIVIQGNLAFLIRTASGISIFDISDPSNLMLLTTLLDTNWYVDLAVNGSLLATLRSDLVNLVNITDIYNPVSLATLTMSNPSYMVSIQENYLFIRNELGINIFNISNPKSPFLVRNIIGSLPSPHPYFKISQQYAFACYDNTLVIYNITAPETAQAISILSLPYTCYSLIIYNQTLITRGAGYISVIDITDILTPVIEQTIEYWKPGTTIAYTSQTLIINVAQGIETFSLTPTPPFINISLEYSIYLYPYPIDPLAPTTFGLWVNNTSWISQVNLLVNTGTMQQSYPITFDPNGYFNITQFFSDVPLVFAFQIMSKSGDQILLDNNGTWYSTGAVDNDPPELIEIGYPQKIAPGDKIKITASFFDWSGLDDVFLNYKLDDRDWNQREMIRTVESITGMRVTFNTILNDTYPPGSTIKFYIEAVDMQGNVAVIYNGMSFFRIEVTGSSPVIEPTDNFESLERSLEMPLPFPWQSFLFLILVLTPFSRIISHRKQ